MKFSAALFLGVSLIAASPALAQNAPGRQPMKPEVTEPVAGATVFDPQGNVVGTIVDVSDAAVVVDTGTNKVPVPPASFGTGDKGIVVSVTKADLDAAFQQQAQAAQAQLQALLTAGTAVNSSDGQPVGTIKAADPQYVTLQTTDGVEVKLPANAFSIGQTGGLMIAMTAANFGAAVAGSGASAPAEGSADAGADTAASAGATQ